MTSTERKTNEISHGSPVTADINTVDQLAGDLRECAVFVISDEERENMAKEKEQSDLPARIILRQYGMF